MNKKKLFKKILSGSSNIRFDDLVAVVEAFGFRLSRVNGSHHIFAHLSIPKLLNLQEKQGKAKPYQIRQFLVLLEEYDLAMEDDE
ncbi:MAG: addiction module toxin, HicA family [Gemmataceae bacterium]|nr:addiction module toxin, HicA family [Gemmataceae bacterium]